MRLTPTEEDMLDALYGFDDVDPKTMSEHLNRNGFHCSLRRARLLLNILVVESRATITSHDHYKRVDKGES